MNLLLASIWMPDLETMRLILPELLLVATLVVLMIAPLAVGRDSRLTGLIALVGCVAAAVAAIMSFGAVHDGGAVLFGVEHTGTTAETAVAEGITAGTAVPQGMLVADRLGMFFRVFLMIFLVGIIGMWFWFDAVRERYANEFFTLLIASALGMALMATVINLLLMVIAIELASLPSYALAGFDRRRKLAAEASVKYVIFGAVTSGFMIYGVSLLYGMFGTLDIPTLVQRLAAANPGVYSTPLLAVALLAVFAGIAFKISAVPFHFWCPDVFEGAPLPVTTWLSVASKAGALVLVLRVVGLFTVPDTPAYVDRFLPIIAYGIGFFAILTCTVANLAAYRQTNVRRLLAYSSIAHAGYMLCAGAMVVRNPELSAAAVGAVITYILVYMFMNFGAFLTVGLVGADTGSEELDSFTGLGYRDPAIAASLTICLVSLIGIPPMGGFIVKWWLLWALGGAASAASGGVSSLLWILVIGVVINTAISLFYYTRVIREMYLRGFETAGGRLRAPIFGKAALHVCAAVILLTGTLLIGWLRGVTNDVTQANFTVQVPPAAAVHQIAVNDE
jgi:NADH-quinone oxidoreductase subunit N